MIAEDLDVQDESVVKIIEVDLPDTGSLGRFREKLTDSPHHAETVGEVGADWLKSILDPTAIRAISEFRGGPHKALLLRGVALTTEVETPHTGFLPTNQCVLDFDIFHFGMLSLLGVRPHAVEYENRGKLVRNVVPVIEAAGTTSSWGADVEFFWHTDNPNWPFENEVSDLSTSVPTFLAFIAVRNQEGVSTDIACVDHVLSQIPDWAVTQLQKPGFMFGAPASNEGFDGKRQMLPIIEQSDLGYRLRFDTGIVTARDPDSSEALELLRRRLKDVEGIEVVLQSGDFFIFKNARVLHRRKAFRPFPEGKARWLRRVYCN
ncbi:MULTISPECIES: TauD/TfdA family dioxygenase [unclassified Paraburkholderia]|uniref:TauD/TfdA family dioxygenase n=1 Tax=unclassified Paraburkholderia TaxID=2615204 RepID=UPI002AB1C8CE|nr:MULTISPECIES: TauD/TfdA family dioxygenase [unclassified Paraburkholderia]